MPQNATPRRVLPPADRLSIVESLQTVRMPATRDELIEQARRAGAFETVVDALHRIGPGPYATRAEVADAIEASVASPAAPTVSPPSTDG